MEKSAFESLLIRDVVSHIFTFIEFTLPLLYVNKRWNQIASRCRSPPFYDLDKSSWNLETIWDYIVSKSMLNLMKWAVSVSYPWGKGAYEKSIEPYGDGIIEKAIELGNIEMIEWMIDEGYPVSNASYLWATNRETLECLRRKGCKGILKIQHIPNYTKTPTEFQQKLWPDAFSLELHRIASKLRSSGVTSPQLH
jgi:hypothetical protein